MDKCTWKDGKLLSCDNRPFMVNIPFVRLVEWNYCSYCGVDIRKPEKPLIVKSGETVAINWRGKDYLCVMPHEEWKVKDYELHFRNNWFDSIRYKPFSEIELTDEIAKLRPIITHPYSKEPIQLYGVNEQWEDDFIILVVDSECKATRVTIANCRLATPHELQEAE